MQPEKLKVVKTRIIIQSQKCRESCYYIDIEHKVFEVVEGYFTKVCFQLGVSFNGGYE